MKLIDKSALVAEINRMIKHYNESAKEFGDEGYNDNVLMEQCKANACEHILSFINTLEVKEVGLEVGLEEELRDWRHIHFQGRRDHDANGDYLQRSSQLDMAKHFFALGLKVAQKGE